MGAANHILLASLLASGAPGCGAADTPPPGAEPAGAACAAGQRSTCASGAGGSVGPAGAAGSIIAGGGAAGHPSFAGAGGAAGAGFATAGAAGQAGAPPAGAGTTSAGGSSGGSVGPDPTTFYVATDGDDSWSGHLASPAGADGPFRTVARAVKAVNDNGPSANASGISIQIRGGTYFLDAPLLFTEQASGSVEHPVVLESYKGERAVLSGGVPLTNWTPKSGSSDPDLLQSPAGVLPSELEGLFQMLRIEGSGEGEGAWASPARWPKKASDLSSPDAQEQGFWLYASGTPTGGAYDGSTNFLSIPLGAADYAAIAGWNLLGAQVEFFPLTYTVYNLPVQLVTGGAAPALMALTGPYGPTTYLPQGMRFALSNIPDAISSPGEWSIDRAAGLVYFKRPSGASTQSPSLVLGRLPALLSVCGTAEAHVKNLVVRGLVFADAAYSARDYLPANTLDFAVEVSFAEGVVFEQNLFEFLGGSALCVRNASAAVTIRENVFSHIGQAAVELLSSTEKAGPDGSLAPTHASILGNYAADVNHLGKLGAVVFYAATDSEVEGNLIYMGAGPGIQILGIPGAASARNKILYNDVHTVNYGIADGGGIYLTGNDPAPSSSQIMYNRVINTRGAYSDNGQLVTPTGGVGIYLDNWESGDNVQSNLVATSSAAALMIHGGSNNTVVGNLLVDGGDHEISISGAGAPAMSNNVMFSNVVGVTAGNLLPSNALWNVLLDPGTSYPAAFGSGGNLFTVPEPSAVSGADASPPVVFYRDLGGGSPQHGFASWVALAEDTNSTLGGPVGELLGDPGGHVYGFSAGAVSAAMLGPVPDLVTGLAHHAQTYLPPGPRRDCLAGLVSPKMYATPSSAMPDPNAVFQCMRGPG